MGVTGVSNSTTTCNNDIHFTVHKDCFNVNNSDIDYAEYTQYVISLFCDGGNVK